MFVFYHPTSDGLPILVKLNYELDLQYYVYKAPKNDRQQIFLKLSPLLQPSAHNSKRLHQHLH